jgi:RND superfamily putative drug exporter
MSKYLYRLAHLACQRRRLVLAIWQAPAIAAIAAIAIDLASGGRTNDSFTIPGAGTARRC